MEIKGKSYMVVYFLCIHTSLYKHPFFFRNRSVACSSISYPLPGRAGEKTCRTSRHLEHAQTHVPLKGG